MSQQQAISCPESYDTYDTSRGKEFSSIEAAVAILRAGKPVAFPTDTVYGLGVSVRDAQNCDELYRIKRRPVGKPVAWLVASIDDLRSFGKNVPPWAIALAQKHWPGALTLIVQASDKVPTAFQSQEKTIGLRMPDAPVALELIKTCGCPLATTSANISGKPAAGCASELDTTITQQLEAVIAGNVSSSGIASTVIDCTKSAPRIIRQGTIHISESMLLPCD